MSKKTIRIISTIFTVVLVLMLSTSTIFALEPGNVKTNVEVNGTNKLTSTGEQIIGVIRTVGILLSVAILMVLGIKYMMGSAEEKASYKKTMIPYLVGAVLIFAASSLAQVVYNFTTSI